MKQKDEILFHFFFMICFENECFTLSFPDKILSTGDRLMEGWL